VGGPKGCDSDASNTGDSGNDEVRKGFSVADEAGSRSIGVAVSMSFFVGCGKALASEGACWPGSTAAIPLAPARYGGGSFALP
jgi:hypothetical protein